MVQGMDDSFAKPAKKLITLFSDERLTFGDMVWMPNYVLLHTHPDSVLDKIEEFCRRFIDARKDMGYNGQYD